MAILALDKEAGAMEPNDITDDAFTRGPAMTDVTNYAREIGIPYQVFISPQILIDVKEVGRESDLSNLMAILESTRDEIDVPAAVKTDVRWILFSRLMDMGEKHLSPYRMVAHVAPDGEELNLISPDETAQGIDGTAEMLERVKKLGEELSPPQAWWGKRSPKGYPSNTAL